MMYKFPHRFSRDGGYIGIIAAGLWLFAEAAMAGPKAFDSELVFCAVILATAETVSYNVVHLFSLVGNMFPGFKTKNKIQEMLDICITLYMMYAALSYVAQEEISAEKATLMMLIALFSIKHIIDYTVDSFQYANPTK